VNIYSAQAQLQRRAAALLHGKGLEQSSWEELDGRQLADDERGDRTSLLLGGATGGVALTPASRSAGLLARAGTGTLFLTHVEKLSPAARRILSSIAANRRYTPVGDPYPRSVNCRIILATSQPLQALARSFQLEWELADTLGHIAIRAESIIGALESEDLISHPSSLAAAS
jgi:sigma54-dependent transcription regulator